MDDVLKKFVFDNPSSFVKKGSNNTESKKVKQIGLTIKKIQEIKNRRIMQVLSTAYLSNMYKIELKKYTL